MSKAGSECGVAVEDYVLFGMCVASWWTSWWTPLIRSGYELTWARGVIFRIRSELLRVRGVEAVGGG
jgi:hypothetical protein